MSEHHAPDLQIEIDRLVGGELDKPAQRQLVELLDATPGGWRCCALAFMEARSWSAAFGAMLTDEVETVNRQHDPHAEDETAPTTKPAARPVTKTARRRSPLAAAAIACVAFLAGVGAASGWSRFAHEEPGPGREPGLADLERPATSPNTTQPVHAVAKPKSPEVVQQPADANEFVGLVSVSNNGIMETRFAVVGGEDFDGPPPQFVQEPVDDYVRQVWLRKGYTIEQHRKVVSVKLTSGGRLDFPIDWVQYRYVGQQVF